MPDDVQQPASNPSEKPSELEQLIAEAEFAANDSLAGQVKHHPKPCPHIREHTAADAEAGRVTDRICPTCCFWFCDQCASQLDPKYCHLCLPETEGQFVTEPLVDADGVTHEGRVIHVDPQSQFFQPRFGTLAKSISEMRDIELDRYIDYFKHLVKQAETALDFRRVVLGSAELEKSQRADKERRRLRADKTKYPKKTLTVDKKTGKPSKEASAEALAKMAAMLLALKSRMAAKAATPAPAAKPPEVKK